MKHPDYNSPSELKSVLEANGFSMQKKFGQNFLINKEARIKLIDNLNIDENSYVWEIGPGLGAMTSEILNRKSKLTVFEIDKGFASLVQNYFEDESNENRFNLIEGDVLKTWLKTYKNTELKPNRLFGNLPYNIAATIIADTIENNIRFERCIFTVQKEVAMRMAAKPGTEDYSSFSVLCQWAYKVTPLMDLSGANFWPKPNVDSRAVILTPNENFPNCIDPNLFIKLQRGLFVSRRKTIRNNLSVFLKNNDLAVKALEMANLDPMKRAEVLNIEDILHLSDVLHDLKIGK